MNKFKVGDEVKIIKNKDEATQQKYQEMIGHNFLIEEIDEYYFAPYRINDTWWEEDELELVKSYEVKETQTELEQFITYINNNIDKLREGSATRKAMHAFVRMYKDFRKGQ